MFTTDEADGFPIFTVIRHIFLTSYIIQYFLTPSMPVKTHPNKIPLVVILLIIIIIVIISLIIIILVCVCVCLLFTRYKKTLSLYDVITTKVDRYTSNPSYVTNDTDNDDFASMYMDINDVYKSALPPAVNIDENPAYGKLDYDYIYDITTLLHT